VEVAGDHFLPIDPRSAGWPTVADAVSSVSQLVAARVPR
jgi:hypothetical protein